MYAIRSYYDRHALLLAPGELRREMVHAVLQVHQCQGILWRHGRTRDLGIALATGGMVQAHVIRMTKPFNAAEVAIP